MKDEKKKVSKMKDILVETSAHHIHVTKETLEALFGEGFELTVRKELSQPGQYASGQKLDIVYHAQIKNKVTGELESKDFSIKNVSILGPCRTFDQAEISLTEARGLKANVPIRESGDVKGSAPYTLVNPLNGKSVDIKEGMIVAKRHIHMTPADAEEFGVENGQIVKLEVLTPERSTIFGDVVVRVSPKFSLAAHIDTDESNAANAAGVVYGRLIK